jgi:hypothetical protein
VQFPEVSFQAARGEVVEPQSEDKACYMLSMFEEV